MKVEAPPQLKVLDGLTVNVRVLNEVVAWHRQEEDGGASCTLEEYLRRREVDIAVMNGQLERLSEIARIWLLLEHWHNEESFRGITRDRVLAREGIDQDRWKGTISFIVCRLNGIV